MLSLMPGNNLARRRMNETLNCPVCGEAGSLRRQWLSKTDPNPQWNYDCPRCGQFVASNSLIDCDVAALSAKQRAVLSHRLRRQQCAGSAPPSILKNNLSQVDDPLPTPAEQADNLILWIREHQPSHAEYAEIRVPEVSAWIGTAITRSAPVNELTWLLGQAWVENHVEKLAGKFVRLNMAGWQRYEALKHAQVESRTAFMAMHFGDAEFNRVLNDCFKPAVKAAGFELRLLTDRQPAGLIDDQLRVALRTSRFVIADLTHDNNGAYWELGSPKVWAARSSTLAVSKNGTLPSRISIPAT
jgi:hypothetical protein